MDFVKSLGEPEYVQRLQKFCGVKYSKNCSASTCTFDESKSDSTDYRQNDSKSTDGQKLAYGRTLCNDANHENINLVKTAKSDNRCTHKSDTDETVYKGKDVCNNDCAEVVILYPFIYYLAKFGAFMGEPLFDTLFYAFCIWNVDSQLIRRTMVIWCITIYSGQATKDYLRWPRPASPPVIRLESHFLQEHSMPSTHAMAGTAIPVTLAWIIISRYQIEAYIPVCIALAWCLLVCWCRLYLGVHSVLDVLCGAVYAMAIVVVFLPYTATIDYFVQTHPLSPIALFLLGLALSTVCYPTGKYKNNAQVDTIQAISSTTGLLIGA